MKKFRLGQSITVVNPVHGLVGKSGAVVRCRISDDGAWVHMNDPIPDKFASFPVDDSRRDHVILYPEDCQ